MDDAMKQTLLSYDWGADRGAMAPIDERIRQVHGKPEEQAALEKDLFVVFEQDAPYPAKEFVCRRLAYMGSEQAVPHVAPLLLDERTNTAARMALEQIPAEAADQALRDALPKASGTQRVGIINSLGQRHSKAAVPALAGYLSDTEPVTAAAAAKALGQIATPEAAEALAKAKDVQDPKVRLMVLDAWLKCADAYAAAGEADKAKAIYQELNADSMPRGIQRAAKVGLGQPIAPPYKKEQADDSQQ